MGKVVDVIVIMDGHLIIIIRKVMQRRWDILFLLGQIQLIDLLGQIHLIHSKHLRIEGEEIIVIAVHDGRSFNNSRNHLLTREF